MIYEDIVVGSAHDFGAHTFTKDEIKRFATLYDPQYFHTDEEAAAASMLGGLCASGWHTGSVMISLLSRYFHREIERAKREGRPSAAFGPSPGFDDLKWIRPVFPDDTIRFAGKIVAKRESQSRPQWGLVSIEATGTNQKDEPVFSFVGHVFVPRGNPG
ncbi:MAG: MaoC family dehydratase [Bauldia sp.]|nr:MaoC family dehydratase [Bauldia sp.]